MKKRRLIIILASPVVLTLLSLFLVIKQTTIPMYGNFYPFVNLGFPLPIIEVEKAFYSNEFSFTFRADYFLLDLLFWSVGLVLLTLLFFIIRLLRRFWKWYFVSTGRVGKGFLLLGVFFVFTYVLMYKSYAARELTQCTLPFRTADFCFLLEKYDKESCYRTLNGPSRLPSTIGTFPLPNNLRQKKNQDFDLFYVGGNRPSSEKNLTGKIENIITPISSSFWFIKIHKPLFPAVYCLPNDNNLRELLLPIQEKSAYDYFFLKQYVLSNFSDYYKSPIKTIDDFNRFLANNCPNNQGVEPEYTTVRQVGSSRLDYNEFEIKLVYTTIIGEVGIRKQLFKIGRDGIITRLNGPESIVVCGPGIML